MVHGTDRYRPGDVFVWKLKEVKMTKDQMEEIARGNIAQHLGDVCEGEDSADSIYDEAYTLGFDALADAGVDHETARRVAKSVAQCFAQP